MLVGGNGDEGVSLFGDMRYEMYITRIEQSVSFRGVGYLRVLRPYHEGDRIKFAPEWYRRTHPVPERVVPGQSEELESVFSHITAVRSNKERLSKAGRRKSVSTKEKKG